MIPIRLDNGFHSVILPAETTERDRVILGFRTGTRFETTATAGFSRWWLESARAGTLLFPNSTQLHVFFEAQGGGLKIFQDAEASGFQADFSASARVRALETLSTLARTPLHRDPMGARKKAAQARALPLTQALLPHLFGDHPLAKTGKDETLALSSARSADLLFFEREMIQPENCVLIWQTTADEEQTRDILETHFGAWRNSPRDERPVLHVGEEETGISAFGETHPIRPPSSPDAPFLFPSRRKGPLSLLLPADEALLEFQISFLGDGRGSQQFFAQRLLWEGLTGGPTARLQQRLATLPEDIQGLQAQIEPYTDVSLFSMGGQCAPASAHLLLEALFHEIFKVKRNPLTPEEIERARRQLTLKENETLEGSEARGHSALRQSLCGWVVNEIAQEADIERAARQMLLEDRMAIALRGRLAKVDQRALSGF